MWITEIKYSPHAKKLLNNNYIEFSHPKAEIFQQHSVNTLHKDTNPFRRLKSDLFYWLLLCYVKSNVKPPCNFFFNQTCFFFSCYLSRSSQPDKPPVILQLNLSSFHPLMLSNINFVKRLLHSANSNSAAILKPFPQAFKAPCKEKRPSKGQKDWHADSLHSGVLQLQHAKCHPLTWTVLCLKKCYLSPRALAQGEAAALGCDIAAYFPFLLWCLLFR